MLSEPTLADRLDRVRRIMANARTTESKLLSVWQYDLDAVTEAVDALRDLEQSTRYSVMVAWSDEDDAFIATVPELPGCMAHGSTQTEALKELQDAQTAWIGACRAAGNTVPAPAGFVAPEWTPANA